jgi:hypothetical protein
MTERIAAQEWAVMGKRPDDRGDYRILVCSSEGLASRVWAGVPSTPQLGGAPGPGRLPWATFTPRDTDGHPGGWQRIAVTLIDSTSDRDAVGRTIAQFRYVEIPFDRLASTGAGYQALYQAIPAASAMSVIDRERERLTLEIPGPDDAVTRSLAGADCFDHAAGVAALLLGGDVLITLDDGTEHAEGEGPPLEARLGEFDRVLALLPSGLRSCLTLASWDDGTQAASFRLAFGKFPTRGQAVAGYGAPVAPPADGTAAAYLRSLRALGGRFGVERLVEHLARHRAPLSADDIDAAVAILASLDDPMSVVNAVREANPSVDLVANTWRHADDRIDQPSRDELETYLLARLDAEAERAVHEGWSARSPTLAARLGLGELKAGRGAQLQRLHDCAQSHGGRDPFLAALAEGRTHRGEVVQSWYVADELCSLAAPKGGDLPALRQAVLGRPGLARWLLRLSLDSDAEPRRWIRWLDPAAADAPRWLARYTVLATPAGTPLPVPPEPAPDPKSAPEPAAAVDPEVAISAEDLALIAWLAVRDCSFSALAPEWWPLLLRLARTRIVPLAPDDPVGPFADRACADLTGLVRMAKARSMAAGEPQTDARVDTLRLYLGQRPAYYPLGAGSVPCRRYLDALWAAWSQPPAEADISALAARLLEAVFGGTERFNQPATNPYSDSAVTLLREVVTDDRVPLSDLVARAIARIIAAAPDLAGDPRLTPDWWVRVEQLLPGLRGPAAQLAAAVRQTAPAADPADVAVLCGRAAADGVAATELAATVRPWFDRQSPRAREAMFLIAEGVLRLAAPENDPRHNDYLAVLADRLALSPPKRWLRRRSQLPR